MSAERKGPRDRDAIVADYHAVLAGLRYTSSSAHEQAAREALERLLSDAVQPLPVPGVY